MSFLVGLTGGIGSGKSAAAEEFARLGAAVVDTDAIAHELTGPGGAAIPGIRVIFGADCIAANGAMDRARVRARVFAHPAQRKQLEGLLHPMIRAESQRRIAAAPGPYVVHVVPLLLESNDYRQRVQRVCVVDCPEDLQVSRTQARSALPAEEIRAIMATQVSRQVRRAAADDVIDNSGTIDALRDAVRVLHERYLQFAAAQARSGALTRD